MVSVEWNCYLPKRLVSVSLREFSMDLEMLFSAK